MQNAQIMYIGIEVHRKYKKKHLAVLCALPVQLLGPPTQCNSTKTPHKFSVYEDYNVWLLCTLNSTLFTQTSHHVTCITKLLLIPYLQTTDGSNEPRIQLLCENQMP